jgi:hypothetical protein
MKKTNITINGIILPLNLGVNYFYKYCKEATGIDLIADGMVDIKSVRLFDYAKGLVYGGYAAECSVNKTPIVHTPADIEAMVMSSTTEEVTDIIVQCSACMQGTTVDQVKNAAALPKRRR